MISLTAFAKRCAGLIEQRTPFLAYCHNEGYMVLILDAGELTEYTVSYRDYRGYRGSRTVKEKTTDPKKLQELLLRPDASIISTRTFHITPKAATVTGFRKAIDKMRKDPRTRWNLCVVESDGHDYSVDGNDLNTLLREMGIEEREVSK